MSLYFCFIYPFISLPVCDVGFVIYTNLLLVTLIPLRTMTQFFEIFFRV